MTSQRAFLVIFLLTIMTAACSRDLSAPEPSPSASEPVNQQEQTTAEIAWFTGTIEDAFATANQRDMPLFLFWGAEWCPYCKEMQATIFVRDQFIALSRQFIMLDMSNGDSETIRYADEYRIYGLPTVIVFSPDGRELTRIPGGLDMEQYAAVLELTLNALRPVSELVAAVRAGDPIGDTDWQLLGSYSWSQDRGQALGEDNPTEAIAQLAVACPPRLRLASSRLQLALVEAWMSEEEPDLALAASQLDSINAIVADRELSSANLVTLAYLGGDLVTKLPVDDAQAAQLQANLLALLTSAVENSDLDLLNRAAVLSGWSEVATARLEDGGTLTVAQIDWARIRADEAIVQLSPYQLHAGINSLWGVYYEIGLVDQAKATLTMGIERSRAPFYFMSGMAYVEREAGNIDDAVTWYRRAWEATVNPLHRARWGTGYVLRLVQLTPENDAEISRSATAVLADMTTQKQGLEAYQSRIERLSEALLGWSESEPARGELISGLRAQVVAACATTNSTEGSTPSACGSFMNPAS